MTDTNDITKKLLHDLDHQAMEAKGVEVLLKECIPLMTVVLMSIRESGLNHAQIFGTLSALPTLLRRTMCERCQEMGGRIEHAMINDFAKFVQEREKGG